MRSHRASAPAPRGDADRGVLLMGSGARVCRPLGREPAAQLTINPGLC